MIKLEILEFINETLSKRTEISPRDHAAFYELSRNLLSEYLCLNDNRYVKVFVSRKGRPKHHLVLAVSDNNCDLRRSASSGSPMVENNLYFDSYNMKQNMERDKKLIQSGHTGFSRFFGPKMDNYHHGNGITNREANGNFMYMDSPYFFCRYAKDWVRYE